jgi:hypothetical protein
MTSPARKAPAKAIPAGARKPQDRKPRKPTKAEAQAAEAVDGFVTVEQCGMKFQIPTTQESLSAELALDIMLGASDEKTLVNLIGEDKLRAFVTMDPKPSAGDLIELFEKVKDTQGN